MAEKGFKRKLTAILSADAVEYSRLMGEDEESTVRTITAYREVLSTLIQQHNGKVLDSPGDNLLAEFVSVVDAVQCAVAVQKELKSRNDHLPENRRMKFRIGINLGDVIQEEGRIYGDGVNIACRLEGLAEPGGICISKTAFDHIESKLPYGYEFLGDQTVKNIAKPVSAYRVIMEPRITVAKAMETPLWRSKKVFVGTVAVLVAIIGVVIWYFCFRAPPIEPVSEKDMALPLPDKPSIAVLPFANIGNPEQEYIADGITEQITTALARNPFLFVIASNSTFTYKGKAVKVQQVSQELGVRYVVEGSIQRSGERIRITAQLIDATRGEHIWAENYDRYLKDLFALQDEIAIELITATMGKLIGYGDQSRTKGTTNVEAYLKFLKARTLSSTNEVNNRLAQQMYEESIALDPEFAHAYAALGVTYAAQAMNGWSKSPGNDLQRASELAQKAIALDQALYLPHGTLGWVYALAGKHDEAIAEARKAVALVPSNAWANACLGHFLAWADQTEEAILVSQNALRLNPFPTDWELWFSGSVYALAERYEEALDYFKKAQKRNPENMWPYASLASNYAQLGREEEARAAAKELLRLNPKFTVEQYENVPWCKNRDKWNYYIAGLRKAGLPEHPPLPLPDKPSIAVLPFKNLSGDPKQECLSDGFSEDIITSLAKIPRMFVIARESSFTFKGKSLKIQEIGQDLGVHYILEGSMQKSGNRLRITAQLIDATNGNHIWAEKYDRDLKELFSVKDEIAKKIVTALEIKITEGEWIKTWEAQTDNFDAYIKVKQSLEHFRSLNRNDNILSEQKAKEALALDPSYTAAMEMLAWTSLMDPFYGTSKSPEKSIENAIDLAQEILNRGGSDANAHYILGYAYRMKGRFKEAVAELEIARDLFPNSSEINAGLGMILRAAGRPEEAIPVLKKAMRLSPYPPSWYLLQLGHAYRITGQNEKAVNEYKKVIQTHPDNIFARLGLTVTYVRLGRIEDARAEADEVLRINPNYSLSWSSMNPIPEAKSLESEYLRYQSNLREAGLPE